MNLWSKIPAWVKKLKQTHLVEVEPDEEDSCDLSDLYEEFPVCWYGSWSINYDGLYELQPLVAKVPGGFYAGKQVSRLGGDCDPSWDSEYLHLTLDEAKAAAHGKVSEWMKQDDEDWAEQNARREEKNLLSAPRG